MSEYTLTLAGPLVTERSSSMAPAASARDDAAVMRRFLGGDNSAFAELFDRHNQRLYIYCLKLVNNPAQAEDLTQEMWERVIRMRLNPQEVHAPIAFFLRIARNLCLNHLKREWRTTSLAMLPESAHPRESPEERSEMEELVDQALAELPFEYREVLVLNTYCGYRYEEIATMLGKSSASIWMRASRARARLRETLTSMISGHRAGQERGGSEHDLSREECP